MNDTKLEILRQVAGGEITPEEGAARLGALETEPAPAAPNPEPHPPQPVAATVRRVKVSAQLGTAEIVGDPSVSVAVADGPHQARQDGDTMVIEHQTFGESDTFTFGHRDGRMVAELNPHRRMLTVRMNPNLELVTDVQAGSVRVTGVHAPITSSVQAGNLSLTDFRGPLNVSVQAGNVDASGSLDHGESRIRCEMGSVKVRLQKGSSVRISARTQMGKTAIDGASTSGKDVTVGSGAGTLGIDCTMGNVKVTVE